MKILIVLVLIAAAVLASPLLFFVAVVLLLLLVGISLWMRAAARALRVSRDCAVRAFFGDTITVRIRLRNTAALPIPWLRLTEHRPSALILPSVHVEVLTLAPGERAELSYTIHALRRGLHAIGPLMLTLGDAFDLAPQELMLPGRHYLLVYPRLLPVRELALPTRAVIGDLPTQRRMLGDPARMAGVRDYMRGDPLHDIHWRATAAVGRLQVKHYQPTTALQTLIVLDQRPASYPAPDLLTAADLAVSVAATIADRLIDQRQEVGLATNGKLALLPPDAEVPSEMLRVQADLVRAPDPAVVEPAGSQVGTPIIPAPIDAGAGRAHLMRLFEVLARLELNEDGAPVPSLLRQGIHIPFGATVVLITGAGAATETTLAALQRLRERGVLVELLLIERRGAEVAARAKAQALGIRARALWPANDAEAISA